jgi:hypothetical protein
VHVISTGATDSFTVRRAVERPLYFAVAVALALALAVAVAIAVVLAVAIVVALASRYAKASALASQSSRRTGASASGACLFLFKTHECIIARSHPRLSKRR